MLLSIDIGNTNITLGLYDNEKLVETFRLASDKELEQQEYAIAIENEKKEASENAKKTRKN